MQCFLTVKRLVLLLVISLLLPAQALTANSGYSHAVPNNPESIDKADIFAIDDEIKAILDRNLSQLKSTRQIATALHVLLFDKRYLGIKYDFSATRSAQQVFDTRAGNCISLAILYVSAARHLGLDARFQSVEIPPKWLEASEFYIVPSHINVAVNLKAKRQKLIVEFANIYSAEKTRALKSTTINNDRILAEFYNNIGIDHLQADDPNLAKLFILKAIETDPDVDFIWSNLGVVHRQLGNLQQAERAYHRGLALNHRNLSILNNLYVLYLQTDRTDAAQKLAKKVERYSRKNPYYLARMAQANIAEGNTDVAIKLLQRAIQIEDEEPRLYLDLAEIYYSEDKFERSIELIEKAKSLTANEQEFARYQAKQDYIRQSLL